MRIVTEDAVKKVDAPEPSVAEVHSDFLSDPTAAAALYVFLTLTQSAELFVSKGWSAETIFWSRYYWFRRFTTIQRAKVGFDAGLEQQATQLLEHPFPPCEPDWTRLESLEKFLGLHDGAA